MYNVFLDGEQFPVAPSELTLTVNNNNETVTLIDSGEINLLKKPGLSDFSFKLLLPNVKYPFAVYPNGYQPATYYTDKLEALKLSQKPFYFVVNRMKPDGKIMFDTNMLVSLESYELYESAENGFDLEADIKLKQYRTWGTKKIVVTKPASSNSKAKVKKEQKRDTSTKNKAKTYTVKSGDTLYAIAKKMLGDGSKYTQLAKLNNLKNPNALKVGQVLKLE